MLAQRAVDGKSNEITAIPELLDMLNLNDPNAILAAVRAHWGIENNLHWTMEVTFDEDRCRTRKDASPLNFAIIGHTGYNILKADNTRASLRHKRQPASTQNSEPSCPPLNDLGLCAAYPPGTFVREPPMG